LVNRLTFQLVRLEIQQPGLEVLELEGDRVLLEQLQETLQAYLQTLLQQSRLSHLQAVLAHNASGSENPDLEIAEAPGLTNPPPEVFPQDSPLNSSSAAETAELSALSVVAIRPLEQLVHGLYWSSDLPIRLTTLELFDLAEVLDQWNLEMETLPDLPRSTWLEAFLPAVQTAAIVLVTMGITITGMRFFQEADQVELAKSSSETSVDQVQPLAVPETAGAPPLPAAPNASAKTQGQTGNSTTAFPGQTNLGVPNQTPASSTDIPILAAPPPPPEGSTLPQPIVGLPPIPQGQFSDQPDSSSAPRDEPIPGSSAAAPQTLANPAPLEEADRSAAPASLPPTAQVDQVRAYFQSTWQPIPNVSDPLQYRLVVGLDGTLQFIEPLGASAGTLIDRTGMPLLGESFVSPPADGKQQTIQLILYPDGGVDAYRQKRSIDLGKSP
jgi:hypothetical protein